MRNARRRWAHRGPPRRREPQGRAWLRDTAVPGMPEGGSPYDPKPRTTRRDAPAGTLKEEGKPARGQRLPGTSDQESWDHQPGPAAPQRRLSPQSPRESAHRGAGTAALVQGSPGVAGRAGLRAGNRYPQGRHVRWAKAQARAPRVSRNPQTPGPGTAPATRADAHKGRAGDGPRQPGTQAREPAPAEAGQPAPKAGHPRRPARPQAALRLTLAFLGVGPGGGARAGRWERGRPGTRLGAAFAGPVCPLYFGDSAREA